MRPRGTLSTVWRLLREVDLRAIQAEVRAPVVLLVAAGEAPEAGRAAALLAGHAGGRQAGSAVGAAVALLDLARSERCDAALLIAREGRHEADLETLRAILAARRVPIVTLRLTTAGPGLDPDEPLATVQAATLDAEGLPPVAAALLDAVDPGVRLALGARWPGLRGALFARLVDEAARSNAVYALGTGVAEAVPGLGLPLGIGDVVVLTKTQLVLCYKIALVAGRTGTPRAVLGEILGVLGAGFLLRQAARELVGLVPLVGIPAKVAVAYAGTWVVGRAAVLWAVEGQRVTSEGLRALYDEALARGAGLADALLGRAGAARASLRLMRPREWLPRWCRPRSPSPPVG